MKEIAERFGFWQSMPIRKGYVRGISYVTGYLIREQGAQKCQFTYVSQSDPRGKFTLHQPITTVHIKEIQCTTGEWTILGIGWPII